VNNDNGAWIFDMGAKKRGFVSVEFTNTVSNGWHSLVIGFDQGTLDHAVVDTEFCWTGKSWGTSHDPINHSTRYTARNSSITGENRSLTNKDFIYMRIGRYNDWPSGTVDIYFRIIPLEARLSYKTESI
jgi:hypothetical protein